MDFVGGMFSGSRPSGASAINVIVSGGSVHVIYGLGTEIRVRT